MRSRYWVVFAVVSVVLATTSPALASWSTAGSVSGSSRAASVLTASTPVASATGSTATVTWSATTLSTGAAVTGYRVSRVNTVTSAITSATGGCAGTVTALTCVEAAVPTGRWAYRIEARRGTNWVGPMGPAGNTLAIDATAPTVTAAVLQKTLGGAVGAIRQGGTYRLYANATDTGDPATGVASVRANASAITTGSTNIVLTAGSFLVNGVTYGYRSASLTATNPQAAGAKSFTVTATDVAGNAATPSFPVTVDNTVPAGSDVQVTNGGATPGKAEAGDIIRLTMTEPLDPDAVVAGWTGSGTAVTVRLVNDAAGDRLQIRNSANTAVLPLGTVFLSQTGYVTANRDFTGSSMQQVGSVLVITMGTPSGATSTVAAATASTWTPVNTPYDPAGNPMSTATVTESGTPDVQF